jgi:hypothetical protein
LTGFIVRGGSPRGRQAFSRAADGVSPSYGSPEAGGLRMLERLVSEQEDGGGTGPGPPPSVDASDVNSWRSVRAGEPKALPRHRQVAGLTSRSATSVSFWSVDFSSSRVSPSRSFASR